MSIASEIFIGDAPGIDQAVIYYLIDNKFTGVINVCYCNYQIYDAKYICRISNNDISRLTRLGVKFVEINGRYTDRDDYMISQADFGLAIWDGKSTGTKRSINLLGEKVRVVTITEYEITDNAIGHISKSNIDIHSIDIQVTPDIEKYEKDSLRVILSRQERINLGLFSVFAMVPKSEKRIRFWDAIIFSASEFYITTIYGGPVVRIDPLTVIKVDRMEEVKIIAGESPVVLIYNEIP